MDDRAAPTIPPPTNASRHPRSSASGRPFLEPLGEQAQTRAIPEDQLDPVRPLGTEHINSTRERIGLHVLAYQQSKPLHSLAEVDRLGGHHYPDSSGRADHRLAFSAWTMAAIIATSAPRPTRIVTPSASISMPPTSGLTLRRVVLRSWPTATAGTLASTTAGTNGGSSAIGVGNRRACRRQVNTCCGVSPCRRAISETTAPGSSVSSTIPGLVVLGEPTTASRLRDHFQPARRHVRLKRMVKHRHESIPSKRS